MDASIIAKLGLDVSEFKARAAAATDEVKGIRKGFADFKNLLAGGGIAAAAIKVFSSIIDHAKNAKGEVDENTAAVQRYGESLGSFKSGALDFGVSVVGTFNRMGESLGRGIQIAGEFLGVFDKTLDATEASAKSLAQVEKNLAAAKKHAGEFNSINKQIADIEQKRLDASFKSLTQQERVNALANELADINSRLENFTGTALEQRKLILQQKQTELAYEAEFSSYAEKARKEQLETFEQERKVNMARLSNGEKIRAITEEIAMAESVIASGALTAKNAEEIRVTLKLRQKELSELTAKFAAEELKAQEKLEELAQKAEDQRRTELSTKERLTAYRIEERDLVHQISMIEKGSPEYIEASTRLLEVRKTIRSEEKGLADEEKQIAALLLKGEANLTEIEKEKLKLLRGQTTEKAQQQELHILIVAGVENLTEAEKARLNVLIGATAEIKAQNEELKEQEAIIIRITTKGNRNNAQLTDRQLEEKISNLYRLLGEAQINDPSGRYSYLYNQPRQDLANAREEQQTRAAFRNDVSRFGAEEALGRRSAFDEERFKQYIRPEDERRTAETAEAIKDIADRLAGRKKIFGA